MNNRLFSIKNEREDNSMKKITLRKFESIILVVAMVISLFNVTTTASAADLTPEMKTADFWVNNTTQADIVMMTSEEVDALNKEQFKYEIGMIRSSELENISASDIKFSVSSISIDVIVDGQKLDNDKFVEDVRSNYKLTDLTYAITTKRTPLNGWPLPITAENITSQFINCNEPFVIGASYQFQNKLFYFGNTLTWRGWISADDLAICSSKEEWLNAWKFTTTGQDFVVTTHNNISLSNQMEAHIGSIFKIVPENEINIEQPENTIAIYVPIRDTNGKYSKQIAFISKDYANIGFLPMTQRNLTNISFNAFNEPYTDITTYDIDLNYSKNIYKCFGIILAKSHLYGGNAKYISELSNKKKINYLKTVPIGTICYFVYDDKSTGGINLIYIGTKNDTPYFISYYNIQNSASKIGNIYSINDTLPNGNSLLDAILNTYDFSSLKLDPNAEPDPQPTPTPTPTVDPTPTPSPTPTVEPTPSPTPTVEPTPAPVDEIFTVTFKSNGGSNVSSQKVEEDETSKKPSNPTRAGYEFVGWYTDAACTKAFNFNTEITANTTLYAKWKVATDSNAIALNKSLKVTQTGSKLSVKYGKVAGANNYKIYVNYLGKSLWLGTTEKSYATIVKIGSKKLDTKKIFQVSIEAYDGNTKLASSIKAFVAGAKNKKFTNTKSVKVASSVTIAKGKSSTLKPKTTLANKKKKKLSTSLAKEFRYASSNTSVASVSAKGKISGKAVGTARVYVYSRNGYTKTVKVTVK